MEGDRLPFRSINTRLRIIFKIGGGLRLKLRTPFFDKIFEVTRNLNGHQFATLGIENLQRSQFKGFFNSISTGYAVSTVIASAAHMQQCVSILNFYPTPEFRIKMFKGCGLSRVGFQVMKIKAEIKFFLYNPIPNIEIS